jgi:hypothetical protein
MTKFCLPFLLWMLSATAWKMAVILQPFDILLRTDRLVLIVLSPWIPYFQLFTVYRSENGKVWTFGINP